MNATEAEQLVGILEAAYPNHPTKPATASGYFLGLRDLPFVTVMAAAEEVMRTSRFFPTVAEIREIVATSEVAGDLIPEEAWAEVRSEARRVGFNRPPTFHRGVFHREEPRFSSPLIERAVQAVGWETICTGNNERGFIRDQFVKALAAIARHEVKRAQAGEATGTDPALPEGVTAIGRGAAD
jgi:hypothetical protein